MGLFGNATKDAVVSEKMTPPTLSKGLSTGATTSHKSDQSHLASNPAHSSANVSTGTPTIFASEITVTDALQEGKGGGGVQRALEAQLSVLQTEVIGARDSLDTYSKDQEEHARTLAAMVAQHEKNELKLKLQQAEGESRLEALQQEIMALQESERTAQADAAERVHVMSSTHEAAETEMHMLRVENEAILKAAAVERQEVQNKRQEVQNKRQEVQNKRQEVQNKADYFSRQVDLYQGQINQLQDKIKDCASTHIELQDMVCASRLSLEIAQDRAVAAEARLLHLESGLLAAHAQVADMHAEAAEAGACQSMHVTQLEEQIAKEKLKMQTVLEEKWALEIRVSAIASQVAADLEERTNDVNDERQQECVRVEKRATSLQVEKEVVLAQLAR